MNPIISDARAPALGNLAIVTPDIDDAQIPAHLARLGKVVEGDVVSRPAGLENVTSGVMRGIEHNLVLAPVEPDRARVSARVIGGVDEISSDDISTAASDNSAPRGVRNDASAHNIIISVNHYSSTGRSPAIARITGREGLKMTKKSRIAILQHIAGTLHSDRAGSQPNAPNHDVVSILEIDAPLAAFHLDFMRSRVASTVSSQAQVIGVR